QHEIRRLEIPMYQLLLCRCGQGARNLEGDTQRFNRRERAPSLHIRINVFTVDELHGVEVAFMVSPEMKDRGNILMTKGRGRPGLPQKSLSGHIAIEVGVVDNLQGHRRPEIRVKGLVGDAHGASAQLPKTAIVAS